jgi:3-phenylpropionate/trans-cinnamate dioxygenase ferredoxin subunit
MDVVTAIRPKRRRRAGAERTAVCGGVRRVWPPLGKGDAGMAGVTITVRKNGPYLVSGAVELRDADGNLYPAKETVALCRCGASTKKPFCDGTHSKLGFQAAERAVPGSAEG